MAEVKDRPPTRAVTLIDVATRAGVSQPTASRVLNGSVRRPAPDIVARVRRAADELGYTPNAQAQALARASSGLIGLVVPDIADPYFSSVASGVQRAADEHDRQTMLAVSSRDPERELRCIEAFAAHRTEAIIMVGSRSEYPEGGRAASLMSGVIRRFQRSGGRLVAVGQAVEGAASVVPDDHGAAAALGEALIGLGLRRFVVLAGPEGLTTAEHRVAGLAAGLRVGPHGPPAVIRAEFTRDGGYVAAQAAIARFRPSIDRPVCLVAGNDVMALGAMTAAVEAGLDIPGVVQVTGFDDIPTLVDVRPGLTTVRLPMHTMGQLAVELALDDQIRTISIDGEVVLRGSTGRPD